MVERDYLSGYYRPHVERAPNLLWVNVRPPGSIYSAHRHDTQFAHSREIVNDSFSNTIAEVFGVGLIIHVGQRQDGYRVNHTVNASHFIFGDEARSGLVFQYADVSRIRCFPYLRGEPISDLRNGFYVLTAVTIGAQKPSQCEDLLSEIGFLDESVGPNVF